MRYLTRKPVSSTETPAASGEGLQGFASGGRVLTKKQREVAQIVYGLKDSEVDAWEKNPDNRIKVYRIIKGDTTKETKATGIKPNDPNRIIVKAPRGTEKVSDVIFPNKQIEKSFIKDVKKKFSSPVSASEITFASLAENYPISEKQAGRAVRFLKNKLNLEYPAGTPTKEYYSPEAIKERYGDVTSRKIEEKISKTKTPILKELDLRKKIDLAHRVSKRHMNRLGIQFNTDLVGMDSRLINQIIVKPSESTLKNLYNKQYTLFNNAKKSGITEDISKKLEDINSKIINEVNKTSGRLVGVIVDPKTLETSFHGVNKKLSLDSKTIDLKNLEKLPLEKQAEYLSRVVPKAVNAEVSRGFVPNDFSEILKDPKRQESMIKYTQRVAPELTKDLKEIFKNPTSTKPLKLYADQTGIGQFLETEVGQRLSKSAPNFLKGITKVSTMTGAPVNALIGIVANSEDFKEQGLSDLETLAAGAYKGSTQDFLNFADLIVRKLPVATYEKFVENKPFFENILNKPEYFEFADKQIDKYTESKSLQDRLENRDRAAEFTPFPITDADKQYQYLEDVCTRQIMIAHRVTSPLLFGIREGGGLGSNKDEMETALKIFNEQVIEPSQRLITDAAETILQAANSSSAVFIVSNGEESEVDQLDANQMAAIVGIVEKVNSGALTSEQGSAILMNIYGVNEEVVLPLFAPIGTSQILTKLKKKVATEVCCTTESPEFTVEEEDKWLNKLSELGEIVDDEEWELMSEEEAGGSLEELEYFKV